jgi:predicted nucleic acid-binding protein
MKRYFLDTSFLIALEIQNDSNHEVAKIIWKQVLTDNPYFYMTSFIFDETVTFLNARGFHSKAVELGNNILKSSSISFVHVTEELFKKGWKMFQKYSDKKYSLTDCISFITMKEEKIKLALTFDNHFEQAGFIRLDLRICCKFLVA